MKITPFIGIAALVAALCVASYKMGVSVTREDYAKQLSDATADALAEQTRLQGALDDIGYKYYTSSVRETERITELQRQLRDRQDAVRCTKDTRGDTVAILPDSIVRLLNESTNNPALHKAVDQSCAITEGHTVTADNHVEYTVCIIGRYNKISLQLNQLIEAIGAR